MVIIDYLHLTTDDLMRFSVKGIFWYRHFQISVLRISVRVTATISEFIWVNLRWEIQQPSDPSRLFPVLKTVWWGERQLFTEHAVCK